MEMEVKMGSKELAKRINDEVSQYPSLVQNLIKGTLDLLKNEVKEGRVLVTELLESEDKFFQTITDIIDLNWQTGIFDAFDNPAIRKVVEGTLKPMLKKFLGDDWLSDLRKILN